MVSQCYSDGFSGVPAVPVTISMSGVIIGIFFIALFDVLEYLDQFKRKLVKGVGHSDPLLTPPPLSLSQKPKFWSFLEGSPLEFKISIYVFFMPIVL